MQPLERAGGDFLYRLVSVQSCTPQLAGQHLGRRCIKAVQGYIF